MPAHAILSPSSAERWISCPASVRVAQALPRGEDSEYAAEGTCAHELAFLKASLHFGKINRAQFITRRAKWRTEYADILGRDEVEVEMERHTDAYVDLLDQRMARHLGSQLLLEQRVDTGVPQSWGTADAIIVSPVHVEVIDFKYGQGVVVEAKGNPQIRLYAVGALDSYGDILGDTKAVYLTIHQPRLDHILDDEMTPASLREWRDGLVPIAEEALGPDAHFGPSESACRWCPASGRCKAQLEAVFAEPFELPELLTAEVVAETLGRVPQIREWLKAFEEAALHMAYSEGTPIPGYKVVLSGGRRSIPESEAALQNLVREHGYTFDEVCKVTLRGIGELEALMGKEKFAEVLEPYIKPPTGSPALVPESDKRPPVAPNTEAQKEFLI